MGLHTRLVPADSCQRGQPDRQQSSQSVAQRHWRWRMRRSAGSIALDLHASFVIFVLVQEAGHLLLECACLQKLSDRTGIVEKLPLQLRGESVPLHDNRSTEAPENASFFLGQSAGRSFSLGQRDSIRRFLAMNRLVRIAHHPILVFGKLVPYL
jgi:hypothetical protein